MTNTSQPIDPHRPWIRDVRDDPREMNWVQTLFNPFGMTSKLHFSRAWTFMFMGRVLLFFVPVFSVFIAGLAGASIPGAWKPPEFMPLPIPALLVPFFLFTIVTEFTSWVAHMRRLADANRSTVLATIVLVPLFLGLAGFALGTFAGVKGYEQMQGSAAAPSSAESPEAEGADGTGAETDNAEAESASETQAGSSGEQAQSAAQRGRRGPPPTQKQMALGAGMGLAQLLWAIPSFFVMLWTLLYVARLPNGGVGEFRTGSDLTIEEQRQTASRA